MPLPAHRPWLASAARDLMTPGLVLIGIGLVSWLVQRGFKHGSGPYRDFFDFYHAAAAVRLGENIYTSGDGGYIYPPLLAVLLQPMSRLEPVVAANTWTVLCAIMLVISASLLSSAASLAFRLYLRPWHVLAAAAFSCLVVGESLKTEFGWNNSNMLVLLAVSLGVHSMDRRPVVSGLALALGASIKYLPIVFLPYFVLRRRWGHAAAMAIGLLVFNLLPALQLGWEKNLEYLRVALRGMLNMVGGKAEGPAAAIHTVSSEYSWSIPSAAARFVERIGGQPTMTVAITVGCAVLLLAAGWGLYVFHRVPLWRGRHGGLDRAAPGGSGVVLLEGVGLITGAIMFSPQTTRSHMTLLVALVSVLAVLLLYGRAGLARLLLISALGCITLGALSAPAFPFLKAFLVEWRTYGGPMLGIAACYLLVLWVGLREVTSNRLGFPVPRRDRAA